MRYRTLAAGLLSAVTLVAVQTRVSGQGPVGATWESDLVSRYVWRGIPVTEGGAWQPAVGVTLGPWSFGGWANVSLGSGDAGGVSEVDLTATRTWSLPGVRLDLGVIVYTFPSLEGADATAELAVTASRAMPGTSATLYATLAHDVWRNGGATWLEGGARGALPGGGGGTLSWRLAAGWGSEAYHDAYAGIGRSGLSALFADVAWQAPIGHGMYVRPHINASRLVGGRLREQFGAPDNVVIGAVVGGAF